MYNERLQYNLKCIYDQHIMGKITGQFGAEIINYTCVLVYVGCLRYANAKFIANKHDRNFHFSNDFRWTVCSGSNEEWKSFFYCIIEFVHFKAFEWNVEDLWSLSFIDFFQVALQFTKWVLVPYVSLMGWSKKKALYSFRVVGWHTFKISLEIYVMCPSICFD